MWGPKPGRAYVALTFTLAVLLLAAYILLPDGTRPDGQSASIVNTLLLVLVLAERFLTRSERREDDEP